MEVAPATAPESSIMQYGCFVALALLALVGGQQASGAGEPFAVTICFEDRAAGSLEDPVAGDLDYNDFTMTMVLDERVDDDGALKRVEMTFVAGVHLGGDSHDIHIARKLSDDTRYLLTVERSRPSDGTETPATATAVERQGPLDVVLFDTARVASGDTVTVVVEVVRSAEPPCFGPQVFEQTYDPWMYDRTLGAARHVGDTQPFAGTDAVVPFVLIVPRADWEPVGEYATITDAYPDFARHVLTGDPRFARWFE